MEQNTKEYKKAYNYSLYLLGESDKTEQELILKLKSKDTEEKIILDIIDKLKDLGLINDIRYAENWINVRKDLPGFNKRILLNKLLKKGIDKYLIQEKMEGIIIDEYKTAFDIAKKKYRLIKGDTEVKKVKTMNFLIRKGYSYDICKEVLNKIINENIEDYF